MRTAVPPVHPAPPAGVRPALPPLFGDRWPGPAEPASGPLLGAVAAVGATAAVAVPDGPTGAGWLYTAVVAAAVVVAVSLRAPRPLTRAEVGWTLAAVALCAVGAVRAAEWLAALCLLAAGAAVSLAVAGRGFATLLTSLSALALSTLRAVPWVARGVGRQRGPSRVRALGVGLASLAVLLVFVPLLASADAAFSRVVTLLLPAVDAGSVVRAVVLFGVGTAVAAGACFLLVAPPAPADPARRPTRLRCLDWAVPTGVLVAVFALFVTVQSVVLFGSDAYVLATTGLTYAEYARGGFWQLLAVTVLALGVLAVDSRWAPDRTAGERATKRWLLAALAVLTLVVVASAISRMWLYQQAYGFTVLRLLVLTCELWLGAGFLLALVAVLRLRPAGLSRPMVAAGMLALLGLAVLDPERFIATHNVERWQETGRLDREYLGTLSADAVPGLVDLPEPDRSCVLAPIAARLDAGRDWRSATVSAARARAVVVELDPICPLTRPS